MTPALAIQLLIAVLLSICGVMLRRLLSQFDRVIDTLTDHGEQLAAMHARHALEDRSPFPFGRRSYDNPLET